MVHFCEDDITHGQCISSHSRWQSTSAVCRIIDRCRRRVERQRRVQHLSAWSWRRCRLLGSFDTRRLGPGDAPPAPGSEHRRKTIFFKTFLNIIFQFFINKKTLANNSSYKKQLKETGLFDVWKEKWLRKYLPVHNYTICLLSCVYFSAKQSLQILLISCFWVNVKIRQWTGPNCKPDVQRFFY